MPLQEKLSPYLQLIDQEMNSLTTYQDVPLFYDPIYYVLELSGKKIRPLMVMLSCGIAGGDTKSASYAAAAVELLHNFTLVHDDIMDQDETRRGKETVHIKWDVNTAILSGDGLLGFAFQKLLQSPVKNRADLADRFTEAMIIICEGQGLDKMFEENSSITDIQYLDMIERKTAALIRMSCQLGAMVAGADKEKEKLLYDFGHNLGMGFQLQDDILDIVADQSQLGKKVGSDFEMHKQTILSIKLRQKLGADAFNKLDLGAYRKALHSEGVLDEINNLTNDYFEKAYQCLSHFPESDHKKIMLELSDYIQKREY
ncbi:MAG: polyprenyl synthetase family protein [Calditrichaeota bacterium]|nr:MAG: polyprenyl synthetase family protein [Calditrichota bacterium]MBL1206296.1 polyprenyl synthetase family protein [Calditrichota bacterium]NOG46122.1 polyprenyl synthetase family protein [Calditrichota bacterium]